MSIIRGGPFGDSHAEFGGSGLPEGLRMVLSFFPHGIRFVKTSVPAGRKSAKGLSMCLAIPAKVIEKSDDGMLKATVGNGPTCLTVSGILLPEEVEIGIHHYPCRVRHAQDGEDRGRREPAPFPRAGPSHRQEAAF